MTDELAEWRTILEEARALQDSEAIARWVAEHADAIEIGLRMADIVAVHGCGLGPYTVQVIYRDGTSAMGATLLEALRALGNKLEGRDNAG